MTDVWGAIYREQWAGQDAAHEIVRDDGRIDRLASAASYFEAPKNDFEREMLGLLDGPVLDLAAGAGSHTLYLQARGIDVTAADFSPGAREVCRARGCRKVEPIDLRASALRPGAFASIIVMGNTLGAHQTPETFPGLLRHLCEAVIPGGQLLFTMNDPLATADPSHLAYQQRNRDRGLPPGLIRMRISHRGCFDDWMHLWTLTDAELALAMSEAAWVPVDVRRRGSWRIQLHRRAGLAAARNG